MNGEPGAEAPFRRAGAVSSSSDHRGSSPTVREGVGPYQSIVSNECDIWRKRLRSLNIPESGIASRI